MYCVNYASPRQLQQTWVNQDKDLANLSEEDIAQLQDYTQRANTTAGSAIALLRLNGIDTYKEPVYFPDEVETELRLIQYAEEEIKEDRLLLYPNPANEYLIIDYSIKENAEASLLTITNINGQIIYQEKLNYQQDELVIITDKFPAGQYFCTLSSASKTIQTEKLILTK